MSETAPEAVVPEPTPEAAPAPEVAPEIKDNPAWQPILDIVPTAFHESLKPVLKDWDRGVNEQFEKRASELSRYQPYEQLVTDEVPFETVEQALGILQAIEDNPKEVWEAMAEHYNLTPAEAQAVLDNEEDFLDDPRVTALTEQVEKLTALVQGNVESQQEVELNQKFEAEIARVADGREYDEPFVMAQIAQHGNVEQAFKSYFDLVDKIKTDSNRPNATAPTVLGQGGGGQPSDAVDVSKMSGSERRSYMARILQQGKEASQG